MGERHDHVTTDERTRGWDIYSLGIELATSFAGMRQSARASRNYHYRIFPAVRRDRPIRTTNATGVSHIYQVRASAWMNPYFQKLLDVGTGWERGSLHGMTYAISKIQNVLRVPVSIDSICFHEKLTLGKIAPRPPASKPNRLIDQCNGRKSLWTENR